MSSAGVFEVRTIINDARKVGKGAFDNFCLSVARQSEVQLDTKVVAYAKRLIAIDILARIAKPVDITARDQMPGKRMIRCLYRAGRKCHSPCMCRGSALQSTAGQVGVVVISAGRKVDRLNLAAQIGKAFRFEALS